jgi:hypothetical protein
MEYVVKGIINGVAVLGVEPFRRKAMTLVEGYEWLVGGLY